MSEDVRDLKRVSIVFVGGYLKKYYLSQIKENLGMFMKDGWGHFYNQDDKRWEFINMQCIEKIYYDNQDE